MEFLLLNKFIITIVLFAWCNTWRKLCLFFLIFIWSYLCNIKERIICEPPLPTPCTCTYEEVTYKDFFKNQTSIILDRTLFFWVFGNTCCNLTYKCKF